MEILLVLLGICAIIIFICIGIDIAKKEKEKEEYKKIFPPERIKEIHTNIEAFIQREESREKLMRSEVIRYNMFNRYEEKKAEGLAELDKWCKQYNMTIHQMEVFLGLSPEDYTNEIIEKLQDIENGIYAPRVGVAIGF